MWSHVVGFSIFPHIGGFLGWFFNRNSVPTWYENLKKPAWCPPNQMFPIAWTLLYTGMGFGSFLIWKDVGGFNSNAIIPLGLFGAQLALNWAWPPLFFGIHNLRLALLDILCLDGLVVATMYSWYPINKLATMLMVPYLAWLAMATCLTYIIWMDNPGKKPGKKQ